MNLIQKILLTSTIILALTSTSGRSKYETLIEIYGGSHERSDGEKIIYVGGQFYRIDNIEVDSLIEDREYIFELRNNSEKGRYLTNPKLIKIKEEFKLPDNVV